jgi:hypothetical protein
MNADAKEAQGWFSTSAAGNVKGRAALEAYRAAEADPWTFKELVLVLDKEALEARAATRRAAAEKAGYHLAEGGGSAAGEQLVGNVLSEDPDAIVFQLYPQVGEIVEKEADAAAGAPAAKTELR